MHLPQKGFDRWVAEHPRVGGPLQGAFYGLVIGTLMAVLLHDDWVYSVGIAMLVWGVLMTWRAQAMRRALDGHRDTPFQS